MAAAPLFERRLRRLPSFSLRQIHGGYAALGHATYTSRTQSP